MTNNCDTLNLNTGISSDLREKIRGAAQNAAHWHIVHRPATKCAFLEHVKLVRRALSRLEESLSQDPRANALDDLQQNDAEKEIRELNSNRRLLRLAVLAVSENPIILNRLPRVLHESGNEEPRIGVAASLYVEAVNGEVSHVTIRSFVQEMQLHDPFLLDELWNLIDFLKFSLLERILDQAFALLGAIESPSESLLGVYIKSLHFISTVDLVSLIEPLIEFDAILCKDPSSSYVEMDFESRELYRQRVAFLARYSDCTESQVAEAALLLAQQSAASSQSEAREQNRQRHIGFYLIEQGVTQLKVRIGFHGPWSHRALGFVRSNAQDFYITSVQFLTVLILCAVLFPLLPRTSGLVGVMVAALVLWIPAMQGSVELVNYLVSLLFQPTPLPKLDFSKSMPATCATLVAVPSLLLNEKQVHDLVVDLEVRYLANRSSNLFFVLLTDLPDSTSTIHEHKSHPLLDLAITLIDELNCKYREPEDGAFLLLHRRRVFSTRQGVWMGWERKRGKLMDLNKLLAREYDAFPIKAGNLRALESVRYVLTLDSDTQLPRGTAAMLIGTIAHPLNQAVIDPKSRIVIAGYGIVQPRIGITTRSTSRSRLASIYSGQNGFDIYTRAASDPYQDLFGVDTLHAVLDKRFPRNVLLSHDLIEGAYARVALAQDIELVDDYPSHYSAYSRRKHRWVRGDWQIAQWMFARVQDESGRWVPNPTSTMSRWKIFDNLRRSLVDLSLCGVFLLGWLALPGGPLYWTIVPIVLLCVPSTIQLLVGLARSWVDLRRSSVIDVWVGFGRGLLLVTLNLIFLLHQTLLSLDAILRAAVRGFVTGERLLEWETAEQAEAASESKAPVDQYLAAMPIVSAALGTLVWYFARQKNAVYFAAPILLAWSMAPIVALWINRPANESRQLSHQDEQSLMHYALNIWRFFRDFGGAKHNYLIPDHVEEMGSYEAARVSPTNIGLLLNARLVALELGFLTVPEFSSLARNSLDAINRLDKFRGHLFNWYSTESLQCLDANPIVSTVDSGNFVASMITILSGANDWLTRPLVTPQMFKGIEAYWKEMRAEWKIAGTLKELTLPSNSSNMAEWITWFVEANALFCNDTESSELDSGESLWRAEVQSRITSTLALLQDYFPWDLPEYQGASELLGQEIGVGEALSIAELIEAASVLQGSLEKKIAALADNPSMRGPAENYHRSVTLSISNLRALDASLQSIARDAECLVNETDFSFLVNHDRQMLSIGYDVRLGRPLDPCYDMMATEARIATFLAVARGHLPLRGWSRLSRKHIYFHGQVLLLSWTGTMFEYLMPALWMRSYPDTLIMRTQRACVKVQRAFARTLRIPWGISESGFAKKDDEGHYQYRAFGIPSLSLSSAAVSGPVVSPYSTFLALMVDREKAIANLDRMASAGWGARYGFFEAADYSQSLSTPELVREWMAHHLGMSLLAIANALRANIVQRWFHANAIVRSTDLILQEAPASRATLNDHHLKGGGLTLRLKVACLRLKPLESFPAESRLKARSAL